jgi:hypothetical protein
VVLGVVDGVILVVLQALEHLVKAMAAVLEQTLVGVLVLVAVAVVAGQGLLVVALAVRGLTVV